MRHSTVLLCLTFLAAITGCESTRWSWLKPNNQPRNPTQEGGLPTVAALVDYLNDNSRRLQSVNVGDLDVTYNGGDGIKRTFGLAGQLVAQKPRNFRMGAKALGKSEVDVGSNDQEFWYWVGRAPQPYQFFCTYKDLGDGKLQMPIPFQPEWIMDTLGMGAYGPPEKYKLEHDAKSVRLVEKTTSPQGVAVRKVIVFDRKPVSAPRPQVTDFLLLDDATGKEICAARISEVQVDAGTKTSPGTGAVLPRRIELRYPDEKMTLALKLDSLSINQQLPPTAFVRQTMPGVSSFNLATRKIDNSPPLQRVEGFGQ